MDSESFYIAFVFVCGICFGSFLNCIALRIAREEDWIRRRSYCPSCNRTLGFLDLIPIFSWLFLKGKCRYCRSRIPIRYPISDLFMGVIFVLTYLKTIPNLSSMISQLFLFSLFFCLSLIDLDTYTIPDVFIVLGILNRIISAAFQRNLQADLNDLIGASLIAFGIYVTAYLAERISGRECMGGGDIKLIFMICLFTGLYKGILVLLLSSFIGLLTAMMSGKRKIPFGPCICLAAATVILYGDQLVRYLYL